MSDIDTVVGKAISDIHFCQQLIADPEATLTSEGVEPSDELLEALKGLDVEQLQKLATVFGNKEAASA